jgi:hypothetical protein
MSISKISVFLKFWGKTMSAPSFSKDTPNKISDFINVSGRNTLTRTIQDHWSFAIADEPIDAKIDGKKMFCVRVEKAVASQMMIGFTPLETFDSNKMAFFGQNGFNGCGLRLDTGNLRYPVNSSHDIIDEEISSNAKEVIVILTISNNGKKKEIRFLCDGNESESSDVSEYLKEDLLFPAVVLGDKDQQIETIPIDQIKTRTPEIENLIKECQEQQQNRNLIPLIPSVSNEINNQVISQLRQQINEDQRILIQEKDKQIQEMRKSCEEMRKDLLKQNEVQAKNLEEQLKHARLQMDEFRKDFLKQLEETRKDSLKQLEMKDQQFQREREISNKQLELERAENQQLRNLLQHKKDEMSAMEIYYLKRESGQRREREEEFKVKEEPK